MRASVIISFGFALAALPAAANTELLQGRSPDPVAELNDLYAGICKWDEAIKIPVETVDFTDDGAPDYLLTYDLPCRGQDNAFAGSAGVARQIWISQDSGEYVRILDVNARDLKIERRLEGLFVILQHQGSYCMTADAAPCFLTLHFTDNQLVWAEEHHQHPSLKARLEAAASEEKETSND